MTIRNVLLIIVDDLRPDLGCYGDAHAITPNLDALAASGTVFRRAYCQTPVCGPSRASLLSSLRPQGKALWNFNCHLQDDFPNALTVHKHFRHHGYTCLSLGKVFHNSDDTAGQWSQPPWSPTVPRDGDWSGRGYLDQKNKELAATNNGQGPTWECMDVPDEAYKDGVTAREACASLDRLSADGAPFLLATGFSKPHLPFAAPKKYWDMHPDSSIGDPKDFFIPENAPTDAITQWGEMRNYTGVPKSGPLPPDMARTLIRAYRACTSYTDAQIGRVLAHLKKIGRDKDTAVVVLGDHGWFLGEHTMWCKHSTFHLGIHAPLIVHAPGLAAGPCDRLVEFTDIFPTLCALTNIPTPETCEGDSFVPLLRKPDLPWKPAAFSRYKHADCVVTTTGSLSLWRDDHGTETACMYYDHTQDRRENCNVISDPAYAGEVARHRELLSQGWLAARPKAH